eukprot:4622168-Pyramimonas_sp.AAC.1
MARYAPPEVAPPLANECVLVRHRPLRAVEGRGLRAHERAWQCGACQGTRVTRHRHASPRAFNLSACAVYVRSHAPSAGWCMSGANVLLHRLCTDEGRLLLAL